MHLALDIGNSAMKGGLFEGDDLRHTFRLPYEGAPDAGQVARLLAGHLAGSKVVSAAVASVVPSLTEPVSNAVRKLAGLTPVPVDAALPLPFAMAYETPHTLGADRLAAAAAGWLLFGKTHATSRSVIIVDAGTAVTYEVVERAGRYLGGAIAPGPALSHAALSRGTAQISPVPLEPPPTVIGRSTREAVQSGLFYGFLDGVNGMLERLTAVLPDEPVIVATGGWSPLLQAHLPAVSHTDPHLVLRGVRLLTEPGGNSAG
jgi:type III pantothenate kinase